MKNYYSKIFISALMLCSGMNRSCLADETPYNYPFPEAEQTFSPETPTPDAPQYDKAVLRGVLRSCTFDNLLAGAIHDWTNGPKKLSHDEERVEALAIAISNRLNTLLFSSLGKSIATGLLKQAEQALQDPKFQNLRKTVNKEKNKLALYQPFNITEITKAMILDCIDLYPTINASEQERMVAAGLQSICAGIRGPNISDYSFLKAIVAMALNYEIQKRIDKMCTENPEIEGWKLKKKWGLYRIGRNILMAFVPALF